MKLITFEENNKLMTGILNSKTQEINILSIEDDNPFPFSSTLQVIQYMNGDWSKVQDIVSEKSTQLSKIDLKTPVPDSTYITEIDILMTNRHIVSMTQPSLSHVLPKDSPLGSNSKFAPVRTLPESVLNAPNGIFEVPDYSSNLRVNISLAFIVGKTYGINSTYEEESVLGYTIMASCRDFSIEKLSKKPFNNRDASCTNLWHSRWHDGSHPTGPWIIPVKEINLKNLQYNLSCAQTGDEREFSGTIPYLPEDIMYQLTPLVDFYPGDLMATGFVFDDIVLDSNNKDEVFDFEGSISGVGSIKFSVQFSPRKTPGYNIQFRPYIQEAIDHCFNNGFENEL